MKTIYFTLITLLSLPVFGQIQQDINKISGTESNPITEIDSIRFNANQMEIIFNNGNIESHTISDINNVTFSGKPVGEIASLNCADATITGTLVEGIAASGVSADIDYTGGNGGPHNGQTVNSTGVTGLTADLSAGNFANGNGTLTFHITGTPNSGGTASFALDIGGETCTLNITIEAGGITSLDCAGATITGTLVEGITASGVSAEIAYTGGNGGPHNGQTVNSTGVTGLTAELSAGNFANGNGTLTYHITGTPNSGGTASFAIDIGGETCTLEVTVVAPFTCGDSVTFTYNGTVVTYGTVENTTTAKCWLDRNLGASQVATSSTDANSYGDLFQWGRGDDGHQERTSLTTSTLSSTDQPGNNEFITASGDWRSPGNTNLWQGVNGKNNPCPSGFRLPTEAEFNDERLSWSSNDDAGAFASPLKLPIAGGRVGSSGSLFGVGVGGNYWSSSVTTDSINNSQLLGFNSSNASINSVSRAFGLAVRCIKD